MKKNLGILGIIALSFSLVAGIAYAGAVILERPSADGTYLQWTPKGGSTHYTMVKDLGCNSQTDYNYTNLLGARDSYVISLSGIPNGMIITQIDIRPCASTNGVGSPSNMNVFYRLNGIDSARAGNYTLIGDTPVDLKETSFTGLSIIKKPGTTLEIGSQFMKGINGARLSAIFGRVHYASSTIVRDTQN